MNDNRLSIHTMRAEELEVAVNWSEKESWNPGRYDASLFYQADSNGFFVGEVNNEIVVVGSAVIYDEYFAFCGLYIVSPECRGKGYGLALTKHRLAYCSDRNVGIDGVLKNVSIYQRIGYVPYYENRRYQFSAKNKPYHAAVIKTVSVEDLPQIFAYDRQCFPADRENFLKAWIFQPEGKSFLYHVDGAVKGYIVRRRCIEGYKIGPLFADDVEVAEQLLNAAQTDIGGESVLLDIPEINKDAVAMAERCGMEVVFATARMYQKCLPTIADEKVFGITTFELG
jgi:GNAT superfamily N-acetyltransferase